MRVARYGVNLEEFERLALPQLARRDVDLIAIDEIGKMQYSSGRFRRAVEDVLGAPVNVLSTREQTAYHFPKPYEIDRISNCLV